MNRHGRASLALARLLPVRRPPVLVLGMPRSGTTWVGRTLGAAPNALYFNEPLSEVHVAEHGGATFFEVDPSHPPDDYVWPLRFALAGVPAFGPRTIGDGFGMLARVAKRVVIKEVNPLAVDWFVRAAAPTLVYVVRHPAAVALSLHERGWGWPVYEQRFLAGRPLPTDVPPTFWGRIGAVQGVALAMAERAAPSALVAYEALCASPEACFADLYEICGLRWGAQVAAALGASTSGEITRGADDPGGTIRATAEMADAWRARIARAQLDEVRCGWEATAPSRYRDDADWQV